MIEPRNPSQELYSNGSLLALPGNIRLVSKLGAVTNALARV